VLLVDDRPSWKGAMQRALRGRREIVVATDYAEALVLLDDSRRWCGLMFDVHLPRAPRGGPDLLQRARSRGCWAPAILVSGELQPALLGEAAELNARYVPFECLTQKALVAFAHESVAWDLGVTVGMLRAFTSLPHHDELTHAEAEVALMLGAGYSAARVAAHREIGERTVRSQIASVQAKIGMELAQLRAWLAATNA